MADLKAALTNAGIAPKDAVRVVKARFPSFDKTLLSKCVKPEKYGVVLHPDGYLELNRIFPSVGLAPVVEADTEDAPTLEPSVKKRSSGHRLKSRISCRLEDAEYEQLQRHVRADGFDTMQAWLTYKVRRYLQRKAASTASKDGTQ